VVHALTAGLSVAAADGAQGSRIFPRAHVEICGGDLRKSVAAGNKYRGGNNAQDHGHADPSLDDVVESHRLHQDDATGNATDIAAVHSTTIGLGRHVKARDLHPGDIKQQHDWSLHVLDVKIGPKVVAVAVTEFGFELHYAADETLQVAI